MVENNINWKPPISKWYNVDKDSYKLIYERAKERLDDVLSESESLTNKSIKMISALVVFLGFFIGLVDKNKWHLGYISIFSILLLVDLALLIMLILPKEVKWRGLSPKVMIPKDFDAEDDREYQEQMLYYTSIVIMQNNIDFMIAKNEGRASMYKWALIIFLILFVAVATFVVTSF